MTVLWHVTVWCLVLTKPVYYEDFLIGGSKVSWERKCLFLIYTATSGLIAALREGKAYMASGKPRLPLLVLSTQGVEWLQRSESRTDSLRGKIGCFWGFLRYHAGGSFTEVQTWAICCVYCSLSSAWPQVSAGPLILTVPLSLLTEIYGSFRIPWIPHVGLEELGALLWTYLSSHLPPPMLHYSPYVILNMPSSWTLSF